MKQEPTEVRIANGNSSNSTTDKQSQPQQRNNSTVKDNPSEIKEQIFGKEIPANLQQIRDRFSKYKGGKLILEKDESTGIATICICSPKRKNALSGEMMVQFESLVMELEKWTTGKAVIIYGADNFFCSGGDMNTVKDIDNSQGGLEMGLLMQNTLWRLTCLPLISVAVIEGRAIGGGAELTTACDFRLLTSKAMLGFVHIKLGICVGWGAGTRLVQLVGPNKALEIMTLGKQLTAQEALNIGLIDGIIEESEKEKVDVLSEAKQWISRHLNGPTNTIRVIKKIVNGARRLPFQESLTNELTLFSSVWGCSAHKQALAKNIKHR